MFPFNFLFPIFATLLKENADIKDDEYSRSKVTDFTLLGQECCRDSKF